jgi:hypothetical protein
LVRDIDDGVRVGHGWIEHTEHSKEWGGVS